MKNKITLIISLAMALVILNAIPLVPSMASLTPICNSMSALLGLGIVVVGFMSVKDLVALQQPVQSMKPLISSEGKRHGDVQVVQFLSLLQQKGRLVDFLMDDVAPFTDEQIGGAARVVHQGCSALLKEYLKIVPVESSASEGGNVTLREDYSADEYKLIGKVAGPSPYNGTLLHKGWKVESVNLPQRLVSSESDDQELIIVPAEVEIK